MARTLGEVVADPRSNLSRYLREVAKPRTNAVQAEVDRLVRSGLSAEQAWHRVLFGEAR